MGGALPADNLRAPGKGLFQECEQRAQPIIALRRFLVRLARSGGIAAGKRGNNSHRIARHQLPCGVSH